MNLKHSLRIALAGFVTALAVLAVGFTMQSAQASTTVPTIASKQSKPATSLPSTRALSIRQRRGLLRHPGILTYSTTGELKSILEHCVGFGIGGGTVAKLVSDPKILFEFMIRRIGVAAVVSCAGGIAWKYI